MKKLLNLVILAVIIVLATAQLRFDLNEASYIVREGFWKIDMPVKGGINPYTYTYQNYLSSWKQQRNLLAIPIATAEIGGEWIIKLIVSDASGNRLQRTILIKIISGNVYLGDYGYDQIISFSSKNITPGASTLIRSATSSSSYSTTDRSNLGSLSYQSSSGSYGSSGSSGSSGSYGNSGSGNSNGGIITNVFGTPSSTTGAIILPYTGPALNLPLPTNSQMDGYINSGDIVSITSIIQKVMSSGLSCIQKTGYLNDLLGRIQSSIFIKSSQRNQLKALINNNAEQQNTLNNQIANLNNQNNNLDITGLQNRLNTILQRKSQFYDKFNTANVDLTPYNLNITINLQNVNKLANKLERTRQQIQADGIQLADTDSLIESLLKQLEIARNKKKNLEGRILVEKINQQNLRNSIDAYNADNVRLNNQIEFINRQKQTLQINYQSLQNQAGTIKNIITAYQGQRQQYLTQISNLKNLLYALRNRNDDNDLQNLNLLLANLNNAIPALKRQINNVRFNCNGPVAYTVSTLDGTITYTFDTSAFRTYVTNQYGSANSNAAQRFLGPINSITLTPITVFSQEWINNYGRPFDKQLVKLSKDTNSSSTSTAVSTFSSNKFEQDFSCSSTNDLDYGTGIVTIITPNSITVNVKEGGVVNLRLGACSNIMLLNQNSAKVGNTIFWRGPLTSTNNYNVFSALLV